MPFSLIACEAMRVSVYTKIPRKMRIIFSIFSQCRFKFLAGADFSIKMWNEMGDKHPETCSELNKETLQYVSTGVTTVHMLYLVYNGIMQYLHQ